MAYVTGSDVKNKKPDPELFLTAAERMGLEPSCCVVIEDAPDGVAAAKAAGSGCVAVTNSAPAEKLMEADWIVSTLDEVGLQTIMDLVGNMQKP
jgi:sugar-phosphatase